MQEIRAQSVVWKDPTCLAETKPVGVPQAWNHVLESRSHKYRAHLLKLLKPKSPRSHILQQKKLLKWYAYTPQLERCPHSPQVEKTLWSNEDPAKPRKKLRKIKKTSGWTYSWIVIGFVFQGNGCSLGKKSMDTVNVYTWFNLYIYIYIYIHMYIHTHTHTHTHTCTHINGTWW